MPLSPVDGSMTDCEQEGQTGKSRLVHGLVHSLPTGLKAVGPQGAVNNFLGLFFCTQGCR